MFHETELSRGCRFEKAMTEAKERSRAAGRSAATDGLKFEARATAWLKDNGVAATDDQPKYAAGEDVKATVRAVMVGDEFVDRADGAEVEGAIGIVLDKTSFYAEQGGQVTDTGTLKLQVRCAVSAPTRAAPHGRCTTPAVIARNRRRMQVGHAGATLSHVGSEQNAHFAGARL